MTGAAFSTIAGYGSSQVLTDGSVKEMSISNLLGLILVELRTMNDMHREAYNIEDDLPSLREATTTAIVNKSEFAPSSTISNPS